MVTSQKPYDTIVVGGGITGLATAYFLQKQGQDVLLLEKSLYLGGQIRSRRQEGFLIEYGPRALRPAAHTLALVKELDLEEDIVWASPEAHKRYLYLEKGLTKVSPYLLLKCGLPLLKDLFMGPRSLPEETIACFSKRHFGTWFTENIMDPLTIGIYGGDISRLSLDQSFPLLKKFEKEKGSVIRGFLAERKKGSQHPALYSFRKGMQTLPDSLSKKLGENALTGQEVLSCEKRGDLWCVKTPKDTYIAKKVIHTGKKEGEYASLSVVTLAYSHKCLEKPGFGFLVPSHRGLSLKGAIFESNIFQEEKTRLSFMMSPLEEKEAFQEALKAAKQILGIQDNPVMSHYFLAREAIPQYLVGQQKGAPVGVNACLEAAACLANDSLS